MVYFFLSTQPFLENLHQGSSMIGKDYENL